MKITFDNREKMIDIRNDLLGKKIKIKRKGYKIKGVITSVSVCWDDLSINFDVKGEIK